MKNKRGFTLIELIGTIAIIGIIFGLAVIGYVSISNNIKKVYYSGLEESIKEAAVEYYSYNKNSTPTIFGSQTEVTLDTLINNQYISEVKDQKGGNGCSLSQSKVIAYRTSDNKINYQVCLVCDDYPATNPLCLETVDYTLKMTANIGNTSNLYKEGSYANKNILLNFKTQNDISRVDVFDDNNELYNSCNLTENNGIKSCNIEIESSGNYKAIGYASNGRETKENKINILIDKDKPTFDIYSSDRTTLISNQVINLRLTNDNSIFYVLNINDTESGFNTISYSLEKKNEKQIYTNLNNKDDLLIQKKLTDGIWELIVIVRDKANNETKKTVEINVQTNGISKNTLINYCKKDLVYNGTLQTLTNGTLDGVEFYNNTEINASSYQVKARLLNDNKWDDNTSEDATFTCSISPKSVSNLSITLEKDVFEYTGEEIRPTAIIKDGTTTLVNGDDYTLSYSNNINIGTATVIVNYKGNYSGTDSKSFTIIKATPVINLSDTNKIISIDEVADIIANTNATGIYEITSSDNNIVSNIPIRTESINANTNQTITVSGESVGTATITVQFTPTDTTNYNSSQAIITVSVRTQYCAEFDINGASEIGNDKVCCQVVSGTSCQINMPSITPIENFDVVGWNTNQNATTSISNINTAYTLSNNTTKFYAITKSKDSQKITRTINFILNGATAMTLNETRYTSNQSFSCTTPNVYNGDPIPTSCQIGFPSLERENGNVYGWDEDSENRGTPTYNQSSDYMIGRNMILYGISSKDITVSYDPNGGETTLESQTSKAYNTSAGAWFDIPAYDNANMCRSRYNDYIGYKYAGLATTADSSTVNACQGSRVYLTNDTTYYAIWKYVYRTGTVHVNANYLYIRASRSTSATIRGQIPNGGVAYVTGDLSTRNSINWYPVVYGSAYGYSAASNITLGGKVSANSCYYTDYVCASNNNYELTVLPDNVLLNFYDNTISKQLNIDSTCGNITSAISSDTSLVTATTAGLITAVSGSVAIGETKTATITFMADGGCTYDVNVTVKNIDMTPPTISMTASGTSQGSGYQTDAKVTATCNSPSGITSYDLTGGANLTTTSSTPTSQIKTIDLNSGGVKRITATCVGNNGIETTVSNTYNIYIYSVDNSCSCKTYKSCATSGCGVKSTITTYSGSCVCSASAYGSSGSSTYYCKTYGSSIGSNCNSFCQRNGFTSGNGSCSSSTSKTYKTCANSACGCSVRNSCWHT